jgi:hypothetical protein
VSSRKLVDVIPGRRDAAQIDSAKPNGGCERSLHVDAEQHADQMRSMPSLAATGPERRTMMNAGFEEIEEKREHEHRQRLTTIRKPSCPLAVVSRRSTHWWPSTCKTQAEYAR